jgi:protein-S-isoprenylcysteine O-methyltransferase Ste14
MSNTTFLSFVQAVGVATGVGFVAMMFLYFRAGPQRTCDRLMSVAILAAACFQYISFLAVEDIFLVAGIACLVLLVLANLLFWSARAAHGSLRPAAVFGRDIPQMVVQKGPYRFIRHPFYLAYSFSYLALALVGNRWWQYLVAVCVFALYNLAAAEEEQLLTRCPAIGEEYTRYRQQSWRWFPLLW